MNNLKLIWGGILVAIVIAIGAYFFPVIPAVEQLAGSVGSRFPNGLAVGSTAAVTQNKLTVGNSGTAISQQNFGSCALIASSFTVAATTTVAMDCVTTGVVSGDYVFAQFGTTTITGNGWTINQASASTTSGYSTFLVTNFTGASNVIPAVIASSTKWRSIR